MNYRHSFHAGNFADVHKHVVLLALLDRLLRKPKPIMYLDTHAGRGWYDLQSPDAQRAGEWREGIALLRERQFDSPDVQRYLGVVQSSEAEAGDLYPGSPILAARQLRDADRVVLIEQQITEAQALEDSLRSRRNTAVVCGDGYAALKTFLPPRENRGLVLIDPPYESEREFEQLVSALRFGLMRWPNGVFAAWYPIKSGNEATRLGETLQRSGLRKLLRIELLVRPAGSPVGLNGSGMIVANPPWQLDEEMQLAMAELQAALAVEGGGHQVEWLVPE